MSQLLAGMWIVFVGMWRNPVRVWRSSAGIWISAAGMSRTVVRMWRNASGIRRNYFGIWQCHVFQWLGQKRPSQSQNQTSLPPIPIWRLVIGLPLSKTGVGWRVAATPRRRMVLATPPSPAGAAYPIAGKVATRALLPPGGDGASQLLSNGRFGIRIQRFPAFGCGKGSQLSAKNCEAFSF